MGGFLKSGCCFLAHHSSVPTYIDARGNLIFNENLKSEVFSDLKAYIVTNQLEHDEHGIWEAIGFHCCLYMKRKQSYGSLNKDSSVETPKKTDER